MDLLNCGWTVTLEDGAAVTEELVGATIAAMTGYKTKVKDVVRLLG